MDGEYTLTCGSVLRVISLLRCSYPVSTDRHESGSTGQALIPSSPSQLERVPASLKRRTVSVMVVESYSWAAYLKGKIVHYKY